MSDPRPAQALAARDDPRVFCIGRNYAKHIAELHNSRSGAAACVVFIKPASALVAPGETIQLPAGRGEIHHEAELVVEIGRGGHDIPAKTARGHIAGIGLGLDLTLRGLQSELKNRGEPWERAKAFDHSAPLAPMVPLTDDMDLADLRFELRVDGEIRQRAHTANMLLGVAELIAELSENWRLQAGDLIFTGTPEGVGPVEPGRRLALSGPRLDGAEWPTA